MKPQKKNATHPLEELFQAKLRKITRKEFTRREADILEEMPHPWIWTERKTGFEWTLLGRRAHLVWNNPPDSKIHQAIDRQSMHCYAVENAIKHGLAWHESVPGKPDILMMWLASCIGGVQDSKLQNLTAIAMKDRSPGRGVRGDGGYLDTLISIVEEEIAACQDPVRKQDIYASTAHYWLNTTVLRLRGTVQADWRPISNETLPILWPIDTVERLLRLRPPNEGQRGFSFDKRCGAALIEHVEVASITESFMDALSGLVLDASFNPWDDAGVLVVAQHCAERGMHMNADAINKLAHHQAIEHGDYPALKAVLDKSILDANTPSDQCVGTRMRL